MANKNKGSNVERELIQMFHKSGWAPLRVAGSGSAHTPTVDIIAGKKGRILAIECKSSIKNKIYISKEQISGLVEFGDTFGAEKWIGMRYNRKEWWFLKPGQLKNTGMNLSGSLTLASSVGITFEELIKEKF